MEAYLRALKVFVVVAGVVLLVGTTVLVWLLLQRPPRDAAPRGAPAPILAELPLPAGARIEQMVLDGPRLVLLIRAEQEQQYLALVNPATGERLSLVRIAPEAP